MLVMVVGGTSFPSCKAQAPTTYCVFESGALAGGRCLTECESRCNLEIVAGCAKDTCVNDCKVAAACLSSACLDARYTYWRCLRTSGQPEVTCDDTTPVFTADPSTCAAERNSMSASCPASLDGGTCPDAGTSFDADAPDGDASP